MFKDILDTFKEKSNKLHTKLGMRQSTIEALEKNKSKISRLEGEVDNFTKASLFLQTLSDTARQRVLDRISTIVTDALQKIKDPDLEFVMNLTTERNQVDLKFVVKDKKTEQEYDILNSCGGSIADIVSFPLKFSLLMKWEPVLSRILILDENFKFVSVADQEPLGEFVRQVSNKLDMQVILVTHSPTLAEKAHRVFHVQKKGTVSKVEGKMN